MVRAVMADPLDAPIMAQRCLMQSLPESEGMTQAASSPAQMEGSFAPISVVEVGYAAS
jgi:hypothetical protein